MFLLLQSRFIFLFTLVFLFCNRAYSQNGDYYVTNYEIENERIDHPYFDLDHSPNNYIYVAHRSGVLIYDGYRWERVNCYGAIYSIFVGENEILVGGKMGFGKVVEDVEAGGYIYEQLSDSLSEATNIFDVVALGEDSYFLNERKLFHKKESEISVISPQNISFNGIYVLNDELFVYTDRELFRVVSDTLIPYENEELPLEISMINRDSEFATLMVADKEIYREENGDFHKIILNDDNYLDENIITSVEWMNDSLLAVGTLKGGVAFFNTAKGELLQIVNSHTGLKDNEVLAILRDKDDGLWVAQNNGMDRIAPLLPITNFSNYPGINGKLLNTYTHNNTLYVSTSLGIYFLKEVKDYREIVSFIKQKTTVSPRKNIQEKPEMSTEPAKEEDDEVKKERKGLLGLFKRKRNKDEESDTESEEEKEEKEEAKKGNFLTRLFGKKGDDQENEEEENADSVYYRKKVFRELQSVRYIFQPIEGVDSNTNHFVSLSANSFLAGGLDGLFEIRDGKSYRISSEPVRHFLMSDEGMLIASFNNGTVKIYEPAAFPEWELFGEFNFDGDIAYHFFENGRFLWFTAMEYVYKVNKENNFEIEAYPIENPYSDVTLGDVVNDKPYFVNPNGYFYYDSEKDGLLRDEELEIQYGLPTKYISEGKNIWIHSKNSWKVFGEAGNKNEYLLNLIDNLHSVYFDKKQNAFWIINADNKLFRIDNIDYRLNTNYNLVLKNIKTNNIRFRGYRENIRLDQRDGSFSFEYIQPDYSGVLGIRYRYILEGMNEEWSAWSDDNVINFPYLPAGDYTIKVQTRDIFGQINQSSDITLNVVPPYWQRPWFYAMEIGVLTLLLFLSIRMNKSPNNQYVILNRLLAFLTLILIVEFIQAIAEAKFETQQSPVIDFFIQVSIAAAILPFEQFLRRWLTVKKEEVKSVS